MASAVATPLEKQFSTIAGVDSMSSVSSQGNVQITIQFSLNRDIDSAAQDVQAAIAKATRQLLEPNDAEKQNARHDQRGHHGPADEKLGNAHAISRAYLWRHRRNF